MWSQDSINSKNAIKIDYFNTDHLKEGLRSRALKGATVSIIAQVSCFLIQTICTIIMARLLTPDDFGLVTMVVTIGLLIGNIGMNGFTEAIIQAKEVNQRQVSNIFWINICVSIIMAALFIILSSFIVNFYKEPRIKYIVIAIGISNILSSFSVLHLAILKRRMQFNRVSANDILVTLISNIVPVILVIFGWGYWALVAKWIISSLVISIGAWIMCDWKPSLPSRNADVKRMMRFAINTFGNFFMNYTRRNVDKVLIGRFFGSHQLGFYDRAFHLSGMLPNQIVYPIYTVAVSAFSRLSSDTEKFRVNFMKTISILAFIGMPLSAAMCLTSYDLVLILLGPKWIETGHIFFAFSLSIGLTIIYISHGWLHLSLGTANRWFRWSIIEFIVTVICIIIGIQYGSFGVAIALSVSVYIMFVPAFIYAGKPIQLTVLNLLSCVWKYFVSTLAAGICCWYLFYIYSFTSHIYIKLNCIERILISSITCLIIYIILLVSLYQSFSPISQFIKLLQELRQKNINII